ncbi:hypothetical protein Arub01_51870 [Actinomadura rubrobrunea]|uniref:Uncharacterized protein n=1 Tax=Actinomadura rubrobrunea TaxID=115335 RepID=A0A9W6Q1Q1_9ACTN|nr:hypothetical protein Arub01_51870 [Actinomadura rubrobrunea]
MPKGAGGGGGLRTPPNWPRRLDEVGAALFVLNGEDAFGPDLDINAPRRPSAAQGRTQAQSRRPSWRGRVVRALNSALSLMAVLKMSSAPWKIGYQPMSGAGPWLCGYGATRIR